MYIITLIIWGKNIISFLSMKWSLFLKNLNPIHSIMLCAKCGWNRPSGSREEDFLISSKNFTILLLCPLLKGRSPFFNKLESPSSKNALFQVWLILVSVSREEIFFISSMYFRYFVIISTRKQVLDLNKLESPPTKDALCQFGWNWFSGSGEYDV